jgi:DNA-binding HxlR family transcriptional regulator
MRLRESENEGLIKRDYFNETPPRVEYSLTKKGEGLLKSLKPLIMWAEKH